MVVAEIVGESGREGEREGGGVEHWRRALQANVLWSCLAVSVLKQYFYWAHKVGDPKPRGTFHHDYIGAYTLKLLYLLALKKENPSSKC
jgi:hypothetical protein